MGSDSDDKNGEGESPSTPPPQTTTITTATARATTTMSAEMQNAAMTEERGFAKELFEAALAGDGRKVKLLVEQYSSQHDNMSQGEILNQFKDGQSRTALHFACQSQPKLSSLHQTQHQEEDIVSFLLTSNFLKSTSEIEALVRAKDKEGLTPLMHASQFSQTHPTLAHHRIQTLFKVGGNKLALARSKAGATALHYASGAGAAKDIIHSLYSAAKVALNVPSKRGGTPLHWAAGAGGSQESNHTTTANNSNSDPYLQTVDALLECGANVNAVDERNMTPLILAMASGKDTIAKALLHAGADWTQILPGNLTLFHIAADLNLVGTLASLVEIDDSSSSIDERRAKRTVISKYCTMTNDQRETPLDLAAEQGHVGCVMLLLPEGKRTEEEARAYIEQVKIEKKNKSKKDVENEDDKTSDKANSKTGDDEKEDIIDTKENGNDNNDDEERAKTRLMEIMESSKTIAEEEKSKALQYKNTGNAHFTKKEWMEASQCYTAAIQHNPTDATYYSNRSACYYNLKQYKQALDDALLAQQLRPNWSKAWYRISISQLELGRYEDAACAAFEGLKMEPNNEELKRLMQKCVKMGRKVHQQQQQQHQQQQHHQNQEESNEREGEEDLEQR